MKAIFKSAFVAGLMLATAAPLAAAPANSSQAVKGIAVVDINAVVANSNAYKVAEQQRPTTYKAQFDAANARAAQINAQLDPLLKKFDADRQAPNANQQALQQQADAIDKIYQQGQREVDVIMGPVTLSRSYVAEQIGDKLTEAVKNAAAKRGVTIVLRPNQVLWADETYNMNQAVVDELNTLLPSVQLTPPPNWLPRQLREEQAAARAAQGVSADPAPAAAPATPPVQTGPQQEGR